MNERALSEEAMRAALLDIRLPGDAAGGALADFAIAVAFAGLAALLVLGALRLLSLRSPAPPTKGSALDGLAALSDEDRRVALLHLLRRHAPERFRELAPKLYRPDATLDLDALTDEVARHV